MKNKKNIYLIVISLVIVIVGAAIFFRPVFLDNENLIGRISSKVLNKQMLEKRIRNNFSNFTPQTIPIPLQPNSVIAGEFIVNVDTIRNQINPHIDSMANKFIVTWVKLFNPDPTPPEVVVRVFDDDGPSLTGEIVVGNLDLNTAPFNGPRVSMFSDGGFVVVWEKDNSTSTTNEDSDIYARIYDNSFNPVANEFSVHPGSTLGEQRLADVAVLSNGNFVVTWLDASAFSNQGGYNPGSFYGTVYGQIFTSSGTPVGSQFQIATLNEEWQTSPAVSASNDGNFIVVMGSETAISGPDFLMIISKDIIGRRFDNSGTPLEVEFQVNSLSSLSCCPTWISHEPAVDYLYNGDFVVTWLYESLPSSTASHNDYYIYARRFDSSGIPVAEFMVDSVNPYVTINGELTPFFSYPDVSGKMFQNSYDITWHSLTSANNHDVYKRTYDFQDVPMGVKMLVNTYTANQQTDPAIASYRQGYVVVWESYDQLGQESEVYGQRFDNTNNPL